ncbi:hypothetical protein D9757_000596 [Collybiopsis confluens]|uniref:Bms1-type G domain-containing protein n=1 Tax=Collybiopsis confluens TaxID=2823264 RepID=A0A8H5I1X0_9AGAR|nr:hypothetical protein D9757_000596 [Collybiopsis confluens]
MVETQHHHRSSLKQSNKPFKRRHTSKGALKDAAKGKVSRSSPKLSSIHSNDAAQLRLNRRNAAKQAQQVKRQDMISTKRLFNKVPRIVTVVSLTDDVDCVGVIKAFARVLGEEPGSELDAARFKTSLQFFFPTTFYATLDALKSSDYVLLVFSGNVEVDEKGETLMRTMQSIGMPEVVAVLGPSSAAEPFVEGDSTKSQKERKEIIKSLLSFTQYFVPTLSRVYDLSSQDSHSDTLNAVRALCEGSPTQVRWRVGRAYLLAEGVAWTPAEGEQESGSLSVTGIVRGSFLDPNRLIQIFSSPATLPLRSTKMEMEPIVLAQSNPDDADSLISTNPPDDLEQLQKEQTWPSEEEMRGVNVDGDGDADSEVVPDALSGTTPKYIIKRKKTPKGMSEYQAAWIVDSDSSDSEDDENEAKIDQVELVEGETVLMEQDEEDEDRGTGRKKVTFEDFEDLPQDEEDRQLASWRLAREKDKKEREQEEHTHSLFPDELDTPLDVPAQTRFARYRGLKSFRTSPWDTYENLPAEYGRIFAWEGGEKGWQRSERRIIKRMMKERDEGAGVEPGSRVTIVLKSVPKQVYSQHSDLTQGSLTLFSLHQHEHKMTVLNFTVTRNTEYHESIRSKDPLILLIGPRKLHVNPIYSSLDGGKPSPNNVHKFERYLHHGTATMATVYGPMTLGGGGGKPSCVLLRENEHSSASPALVAFGTFHSPDTTRIIAKRVILTGHPLKVHKKTATVRYMFFNPGGYKMELFEPTEVYMVLVDDIRYFAPIQLYTKHGRTGHIRESLGTHGYFKAHFDGPISQMDTVCMALYKRVYPKWSTAVEAVEDRGEGDRDRDVDMA